MLANAMAKAGKSEKKGVFVYEYKEIKLPSCEGGRRTKERALASVALAEEGGCSLVFARLLECSYQRTTTPALRHFPSFAGGEFRGYPHPQ